MKIYFEDGYLSTEKQPPISYFWIDARYGVSSCVRLLDNFKTKSEDYAEYIYTNSLIALQSKYHWNKEQGVPELYIKNKYGKFVRVDELTNRELKQSHDYVKLYLNGEFKED